MVSEIIIILRMGGNALGFQAKRLTSEQFARMSSTIIEQLRGTYYGCVELPHPRPDKESHGDVDILVAEPVQQQSFDPQRVFGSSKVVHNGGVISFEYEGHQIDLIQVGSAQKMPLAIVFYSYSDFGMILGMIARTVSLKFGYQGLSLIVHDRQIMLSADVDRIFTFAGLSLERWQRGFQNDKDVFDFIVSSRLFRPSMFKRTDDRWNHGERKSLDKRPMFVAFVEYVQTFAEHNEQDRLDVQKVTNEAIEFFGQRSQVDAVVRQIERGREIKARFNGNLVMEITGFKAKELGQFMAECRVHLSDDQLLNITEDEVRVAVTELWSNKAK
jgi:hypothetical protein